jgi:hypothetical protein
MARAARDMARGRRAWQFTSTSPHARLQLADAHGEGTPPEAEALALRVAGLAINADLPVIVLGPAGGPLADAAFVAVPVPFRDWRIGALVVAGGHGLAARTRLAAALGELAASGADGPGAQVLPLRRVGAP